MKKNKLPMLNFPLTIALLLLISYVKPFDGILAGTEKLYLGDTDFVGGSGLR